MIHPVLTCAETKALEIYTKLSINQRRLINRFYRSKFKVSLFASNSQCANYWKEYLANLNQEYSIIKTIDLFGIINEVKSMTAKLSPTTGSENEETNVLTG